MRDAIQLMIIYDQDVPKYNAKESGSDRQQGL